MVSEYSGDASLLPGPAGTRDPSLRCAPSGISLNCPAGCLYFPLAPLFFPHTGFNLEPNLIEKVARARWGL